MTHLLKIFSMTHIWLIWYAIYISYDFKFQFWFSEIKIFEIRPRKFLKSNFLENAWAEIWLQIWIERRISRRLICVHMGSIVISPMICTNIAIAWVLNAIFGGNGCKKNRPHMNTYQSTRNFTLNRNLKSNFRPRIFEKIGF